jgi:superfamily II DNA/RNA helicase
MYKTKTNKSTSNKNRGKYKIDSRRRKGSGFSSRQRNNSRRGTNTPKLDISSFINKATSKVETVEKFVPKYSFDDFPFNEVLKENILKKNYHQPTPIQDQAIPIVLDGKDIVGLANTGTGKTAAFLLPLIDKVFLNRNEQIIILTPTRELAVQIEEELRSFTNNMRIYSTVCVGGTPIYRQINKLKRPNQFVIGTPGRIMDLVKRKVLKLDSFKTIVLDEADRMLDMGFVNDMRFVMSKMPQERHTLFFSATMSETIKLLIKDFLKDPVSVSVKTQSVPTNIDQDVVKINGKNKIDILEKLLTNPKFTKVLVFGRTKHGVEKLNKELLKRGIKTESIHGDKNQGQRQRSLQKFKENGVQTLIATDVVARGLDINNVTHVINYELPTTYDDYVHRIGRTGRGDKTGKALTFVD